MDARRRLIKIVRAVRHPVHYVRLARALSAALPLMFDDVSPFNIPASPAPYAVAGYVDGLFTWPAAGWTRFSSSLQVPITVRGLANVRSCDCETGDLTPTQAAVWAYNEIRSRRRPTIYCNTSTLMSVIVALQAWGLQFMRDVDWWQAQYDGVPTLEPYNGITPVAKQYLGYPGNSPGPYDVSITNGVWPLLLPPAPPAPDALPGSSMLSKACVARRPNTATLGGTNDGADVFTIDPAGLIWQRGDAPDDWNEGGKVQVPSPSTTASNEGVMAAWRLDGSAVDLWVETSDGNLYLNAWGPVTSWGWGAWNLIDSNVAVA